MNGVLKENSEKLFFALTLFPIIAAPFIAVEFPRFLAYIPIISAITGAGITTLLFKEKIKLHKTVFLSIGAILAWVWISTLWTINIDASLERAIKLSVLLPIYGVFVSVMMGARKRIPEKFLLYILASCALAATLITVELFIDAGLYRLIRGNMPFEEYEGTAVFNRGAITCILAFISAFMLLDKRSLNYKCIAGVIAPVMVMLFLVQSQSAQLAFVFCLCFYALFRFSKRWMWIALFSAMSIFILTKPYLAEFLNAHSLESYKTMPVIKDAYLWHRFQIWDFVSQYTRSHNPIWGNGIEITKTLKNDVAFGSGILLHPHSTVLQVWIEFGLIGILLSVIGLGLFMKSLYKNPDRHFKRAALTTFMTVFAVANFSYGMWQSWWLGMLFILAAIYIVSAPEQTKT